MEFALATLVCLNDLPFTFPGAEPIALPCLVPPFAFWWHGLVAAVGMGSFCSEIFVQQFCRVCS